MSESAPDLLVVLEHGSAGEVLARIRSVAVVTQILAPRLVLIQADNAAFTRVASQRGVVAVYETALPELPPDFTPAERAFAQAWVQRLAPKARVGDALAWDTPGFQPPDRPTKRRP